MDEQGGPDAGRHQREQRGQRHPLKPDVAPALEQRGGGADERADHSGDAQDLKREHGARPLGAHHDGEEVFGQDDGDAEQRQGEQRNGACELPVDPQHLVGLILETRERGEHHLVQPHGDLFERLRDQPERKDVQAERRPAEHHANEDLVDVAEAVVEDAGHGHPAGEAGHLAGRLDVKSRPEPVAGQADRKARQQRGPGQLRPEHAPHAQAAERNAQHHETARDVRTLAQQGERAERHLPPQDGRRDVAERPRHEDERIPRQDLPEQFVFEQPASHRGQGGNQPGEHQSGAHADDHRGVEVICVDVLLLDDGRRKSEASNDHPDGINHIDDPDDADQVGAEELREQEEREEADDASAEPRGDGPARAGLDRLAEIGRRGRLAGRRFDRAVSHVRQDYRPRNVRSNQSSAPVS